ncbi:hypothetical protein SESBI_01184 [Sesbania bispinosa]|nr:hypothetical protein SESBI_01184 [Sesbania bispinosa]
MPPRTRIPARREASGCATAVGVVAEQQQGNQQQNLDGQQGVRQEDQQPGATTGERLWRALGCSDIRAVELASFQLEGVAYDWFDTVTRGRLVGSPPLAWEQTEGMSVSEYSARFTQLSRHALIPITEAMRVKRFIRGLREYIFRSVVGSNYSTFAEVLSLALQLEQRQKEKGNSGRDSSQETSGLRDRRVVIPVLVWDRCPVIRCSRERYHRGVVLVGSLLAQRRVVDQIRGDLHGPLFHNDILDHASAPATLASSQDPSAPVRQLGGSSGRGSGVAQQSGRGSGGRGQAQQGEVRLEFLP